MRKVTAKIGRRSMKALIAVVLLIGMAFAVAGCTVVRISDGKILSGGKETDTYMGNAEFEAESYINELWESKIVGHIQENAQEYITLNEALTQDFKGTSEKFGQTRSGNAESFSFITKVTGKVLEYNTESRAGYLSIDLEPFDGKEDLKVYVGPVFKGDSLRNALPFIKFTDFKSQNDWAKVSKALHSKIDETLITKLDLDDMEGKMIEVYGAFTTAENKEEERFITPVILNVLEG